MLEKSELGVTVTMGWNEKLAKDSARSGGSVGRATGVGASAETLRERCWPNVGDVGDVCGERRRAKEEMGVQEAVVERLSF